MATKYLFALILPGLLVVFFTRVTYSRVLALVLTVALIAASVYKGYTNTIWLIVVDSFSLTLGFWYADQTKRKMKQSYKLKPVYVTETDRFFEFQRMFVRIFMVSILLFCGRMVILTLDERNYKKFDYT